MSVGGDEGEKDDVPLALRDRSGRSAGGEREGEGSRERSGWESVGEVEGVM